MLIYANKQELPQALSVQRITDIVGLNVLKRPWYIQGCCAKTADGLYEGIDWMVKTCKKDGKPAPKTKDNSVKSSGTGSA